MADMTATESYLRECEDRRAGMRLHDMHRRFRERWSPEDRQPAAEFEADLAVLLIEMQREALRPFQEAAARSLTMLPPPPGPFVFTGVRR